MLHEGRGHAQVGCFIFVTGLQQCIKPSTFAASLFGGVGGKPPHADSHDATHTCRLLTVLLELFALIIIYMNCHGILSTSLWRLSYVNLCLVLRKIIFFISFFSQLILWLYGKNMHDTTLLSSTMLIKISTTATQRTKHTALQKRMSQSSHASLTDTLDRRCG